MGHPRAEQIRREAKPDPVYPARVPGMTWCTSNRNFTLNTLKGHCVRFRKNVPKLTPNLVLEDAMAVGIMPTDEVDLPSGDEDEHGVLPAETTGSARIAAIRRVCEALKDRNGRNDFNAAGQPNHNIINKSLGYNVDVTEVAKVWRQMQAEAAEGILADPDEAIDDVGPMRPEDSIELMIAVKEAVATVLRTGSEDHMNARGVPTVRAVENILGYEITEDERDAAFSDAGSEAEAVTMQSKPEPEPKTKPTDSGKVAKPKAKAKAKVAKPKE